MKRKPNLKLTFLLIATLALGLFLTSGTCSASTGVGSLQLAEAQAAAPATGTPVGTEDAEKEAQPKLELAQQKKLASELFGLTKTVKSSQQLSAMIAKCDTAADAGLNEKYFAYVRSLKAWALNRRGNNRYETAKQLKAIDNLAQYELAFEQAMADFNDSIAVDTARYHTFNSRGIAFVLNEQYEEAAKDFTKAVALRADFTQGYFNRAEALSAISSYELALKDYTTVLRLSPDDAQAMTGRAHSNVALENYEAALPDYEAVIKAYPTNAVAVVNRGDCHAAAGNWKQSLADYAFAKKLVGFDLASSGPSKVSDLIDQRTAWVLATASDASIRDGGKAIALIEPCVDRSSSPTTAMLETLAAAQAITGDFEAAKQNQSKVIQLTGAEVPVDQNQTDDSPQQVRMTLYEEEKAYVQPEK